MSTQPPSNPSFYLDGQVLQKTAELKTWETFEDICCHYSNLLHSEGRAILSVKLDGIEIDCSTPPSQTSLQTAKKIEVESCMFEELIQATLEYHIKESRELVDRTLELSTDCLIMTPQETFEEWKKVLEGIKNVVGFIPKIFSLQPFANPIPEETSEEYLTRHIHQIQDIVETCRKAWDIQDVVLFSDSLEMKIAKWLNHQIEIVQKLKAAIHIDRPQQD